MIVFDFDGPGFELTVIIGQTLAGRYIIAPAVHGALDNTIFKFAAGQGGFHVFAIAVEAMQGTVNIEDGEAATEQANGARAAGLEVGGGTNFEPAFVQGANTCRMLKCLL